VRASASSGSHGATPVAGDEALDRRQRRGAVAAAAARSRGALRALRQVALPCGRGAARQPRLLLLRLLLRLCLRLWLLLLLWLLGRLVPRRLLRLQLRRRAHGAGGAELGAVDGAPAQADDAPLLLGQELERGAAEVDVPGGGGP
jgi:hypothetical protein